MSLNLILAIVVGCIFFVCIVVFAIALIYGATHQYVCFDEAFEPHGFTGENFSGFGRRYTGEVSGREASCLFPPRHRYPMKFDMSLSANHRVKVSLGASRPLLTERAWKKLDGPVPGLEDARVFTDDPGRARAVLKGRALDAARRLLFADMMRKEQSRELYLRSGEVLLRRVPPQSGYNRIGVVTAQDVQGWYADLLILAEAAEAI